MEHVPFEMKGYWHEQYFHNDHPIVLELGCGKGEYTIGLAQQYPDVNFIGVDIKGARMWTGATQALNEGLKNVAFLRTNIEIIDRFFAPDEVQEIWLTFSDPQMKNPRKRLTSTWFLERYRHFLVDGGIIHLKTDSNFLFTYTEELLKVNNIEAEFKTRNLYASPSSEPEGSCASAIQTYYESMWRARGIDIKYLCFRLPQGFPLVEPEVEIPLDEYRSYSREKRSGCEKHV
jgi:tRNA (guanine-N7-)-methyltransferase